MKLIGNVNKSAAAGFFGVTTQSLDRWFISGCPVAKRNTDGAIVELDLAEMAKWRIDRARDLKEPEPAQRISGSGTTQQRIVAGAVKRFACEILVPCLVNDFRADIKRIAKLGKVPEKAAIEVWSVWAVVCYESLQRLFEDKDITVNHTQLTTNELKRLGDRDRKRGEKNQKRVA